MTWPAKLLWSPREACGPAVTGCFETPFGSEYLFYLGNRLVICVSESLLLYSVTHMYPHGSGEQGASARHREALGTMGSGFSISWTEQSLRGLARQQDMCTAPVEITNLLMLRQTTLGTAAEQDHEIRGRLRGLFCLSSPTNLEQLLNQHGLKQHKPTTPCFKPLKYIFIWEMPTSAIKSTFISFIWRFSHAQQLERAWAAVHKPHFNLLSLQGCGCNWPFRGNSSWSNQAVAQLRAHAFILVLTWLIEGSLPHIWWLMPSLKTAHPSAAPSSLNLGARLSLWPQPMGLLCPNRPQGSATPSPWGRAPVPSSSSGPFGSTSPAPAKLCACVCASVCVHASMHAWGCARRGILTSALQYFHLQNKIQNGSGSSQQRPWEPMGAQHPWGPSWVGGLLLGTGASSVCVRESPVSSPENLWR